MKWGGGGGGGGGLEPPPPPPPQIVSAVLQWLNRSQIDQYLCCQQPQQAIPERNNGRVCAELQRERVEVSAQVQNIVIFSYKLSCMQMSRLKGGGSGGREASHLWNAPFYTEAVILF